MSSKSYSKLKAAVIAGGGAVLLAGCTTTGGHLVQSPDGAYYYLTTEQLADAVSAGSCKAENCVEITTSTRVTAREQKLEPHRLSDAENIPGLDQETRKALDRAIRDRQSLGEALQTRLGQFGYSVGSFSPTKPA